MKILLDHNLDRRLKKHFIDFEVRTTPERGWSDVLNGELLTLAESHRFDVLITADSNIKNQQNFADRRISVLVIRAYNNRLSTHRAMIDETLKALSTIRPGDMAEVFHRDMIGSKPLE